MSITSGDVARLAALARLSVSDSELDVLAAQLDVIVAAVATVAEVSAADVPPTSHPLPLTNATRPDVVLASLPVDEVMAGAPAAQEDRFRVPRMLDDEH